MDDVRNRLDQDLKTAISRLGHLSGAAAIEERPWTIRDSRGGRSQARFPHSSSTDQQNESRKNMNIFSIIDVVVVVLVLLG